MAVLPSFDAEVRKASAAASAINERLEPSLAFLGMFATSGTVSQDVDFETENRRVHALVEAQVEFDEVVAGLANSFAAKTDTLYEHIDSMNAYTGLEALVAVFSKRKAQQRRAARISRLAIIPTLQNMIMETDPLFALLSHQRTNAVDAQADAEKSVVQMIDKRKSTTAIVESTHRRCKELNAQLAIVQRKIAATADDAVRSKAEADCVPLAAELQDSETKEKAARADLEILERAVATFETFVQTLNDMVVGHTICLNKLGVETERCILLHYAVGGTLHALGHIPLGASAHLAELIDLHAQNSISLNDLLRRKKRIDDAFASRFRRTA